MAKSHTLKKLRILFNSNAPWATSGYSQQMAELLPAIKSEGYPLGCIDFYGLDGGRLMIDGVMHYPKMGHVYGSDAMIHHGKDFKADVVIGLQDTWVLNPDDLRQVNRWIPILPVDHEPAPPAVLDKLKYAYRIITYSKFGQRELEKHKLHSTYIPHTVNTEVYKPLDKKERKKAVGLPEDSFIIGMVAANKDNPPRKSFQEVMEAFAVFLQKYPKSYLYLHTLPDFPGGFPIKHFAKFLSIDSKILFPEPYEMSMNTDKAKMNLIYNTMDVLLMPSKNEGFGVPAIEAQACGVPVIVNDFTSMPELIDEGITGYTTDVIHKTFDGLLSYTATPSPKSIYDCLVKVKQSDRAKMGEKARAKMVKEYDTKKVFSEKWLSYLELLESEVYKKQ